MCCKTPLDADRLEATICIEKKVCTRNPLVEVAPGTLVYLPPILSGSKFEQSPTLHFTDLRAKIELTQLLIAGW